MVQYRKNVWFHVPNCAFKMIAIIIIVLVGWVDIELITSSFFEVGS